MEYSEEAIRNAQEGLTHLYNQMRELGNEKGNLNEEFKNKFLDIYSFYLIFVAKRTFWSRLNI